MQNVLHPAQPTTRRDSVLPRVPFTVTIPPRQPPPPPRSETPAR